MSIIPPIIICIFFLLLVYLIDKYPQFIAGSKEEKTDQNKIISNYFKKIMIGIVLIILLGCAVSILLKSQILYTFFLVFPIIIMPLFIILKNYKAWKKKAKPILVIYIVCLFIIGGFIIYSISNVSIILNNRELSISGIYGEVINKNEIENVTWSDSIPQLGIRTNGFALGDIKKGNFKYNDTTAKVFIETEDKPSIILHLKNGRIVILSLRDKAKMLEIYNNINIRLTTVIRSKPYISILID